MAEQRALHQLARNGRQVHGNERRVGVAALAVNQPREQLFAGSAFAQDQHRGGQLRHFLHQVDDVARQLARPDHKLAVALVGDLRAERHHLPIQILAFACVMHERPQRLVIEVFRRVVVRADLHRLHGGLDFGDGRNHDHFDETVVFLHDAQHVEAVDARQPHVEQHQVHVFAIQNRERGFAACRAQHAVIAPENGVQRVPHPLVVVDDEDGLWLEIHEASEAIITSENRCRVNSTWS